MANENKHIEQVDSIRSKRREEFALKKLSEWKYGIESSLTAKDLLLAADALLKEANSIYPPLSLVTGSSPSIYLELAFAGSKDKDNTEQERKETKPSNELDKVQAVSNKNYDQEARDLESIKAFNNKSIDGQQKREIDDFNRYILHGTKFISSYVRPIFNRVIEAIDDNKLSKFAAPRRGSFVDFLENPKTFSLYIEALRKEYKRKQDYLEVINNREGVYQKLLSLRHAENNQNGLYQKFLSLVGAESSVSPETLKQKLDMLQAKKEQITADSGELGKLKDLIDAAEILIKKRQAWQLTESDKLYVKSEHSKEQNENVRKKAEAMSSMSLRDAIGRQDIDENLRLAIVNDKLADDIDSPDPEELTEALDLAAKYGRERIYLRLLKEGARHSEKYLKDLEYLKNLNRVKTTPLSSKADDSLNQPQSPSRPTSPSLSDSESDSDRESVISRSETPEPSRPASPSFSDSDSEFAISRLETPEPGAPLSQPVSSSLSDSDKGAVISRSITPEPGAPLSQSVSPPSDTDNKPNSNRRVAPGTPSGHVNRRIIKLDQFEIPPKDLPEVDKGKPSPNKSKAGKGKPSPNKSKAGKDKPNLEGTPVGTQPKNVPLGKGSVEKNLGGESPKAVDKLAGQASVDRALVNAQPSETPEPRDESKASPEAGKGKPSVWSEALTWVATSSRALWELFTTPFRKLWSLITKKNQDSPSAVAADQAPGNAALVNAQLQNVPSKKASVEKSQGGEPPEAVVKPADQAPEKRTLVDTQPQSPEAPELRGESKALPEVRSKGESSFGSVARLLAKIKGVLGNEKQGNELLKATNQTPDHRALGNAPPNNVPSNEMSVEEQEINARLAHIPEEERARMLEYGTIGKKHLRDLEKIKENEKQQRVLEEKATAVRLLTEAWQEEAKAREEQAARSLRSPMSQSGFNLEHSITVPAQTIQPVREIKPTAENKQQTVSLSSTHSSMHLNTTRQEIQSVMKIDAKASAEDVMQFFLDHAMRIYLGHPERYLAYQDNKDAETFVNEFIPDARKQRRGNAFKELFKSLIAPGSFKAIPSFDNYLENFATYMKVFAEEIRENKVVVTFSHGEEKRCKHREYKLAAVLAFLIGKRMLEKKYGSNNIPPEKLGQLMLAMAQHFYDNQLLYKGGKGFGSYYPYMDLMAEKAAIVLKNASQAKAVVENPSDKIRGSLSNRGGL
jgi:hypothetical protein